MLNDDLILTSEQEFDSDDDETDEVKDNNNNESSKCPSNADVFSALETAMEYALLLALLTANDVKGIEYHQPQHLPHHVRIGSPVGAHH
ncbi:hypothetical protein TNCV_764931 [Trichonephila clavipes]|nr:hypothetical protein TNCV_764931 [Trichonephila clavipes]